jgi:hypothetical protein
MRVDKLISSFGGRELGGFGPLILRDHNWKFGSVL